MRILIGNNSGHEARRLAATFPARIGHIYGPGATRGPFDCFPYAADNGAWPAFLRKKAWDVERFRRFLAWLVAARMRPLWLAVPDVVANREATLANWYQWETELLAFGWPLAFVVQDGMSAQDVPSKASLVFVGGTTDWKWSTVRYWCEHVGRVHIGRVNGERLLWRAHRAGAESCDGSGWFRGDRSQLDGLWYYLTDSEGLLDDPAHGPLQRRLFCAALA